MIEYYLEWDHYSASASLYQVMAVFCWMSDEGTPPVPTCQLMYTFLKEGLLAHMLLLSLHGLVVMS